MVYRPTAVDPYVCNGSGCASSWEVVGQGERSIYFAPSKHLKPFTAG